MKPISVQKPETGDILNILKPGKQKKAVKACLVAAVVVIVAATAAILLSGKSDSRAAQYKTEEVRRGDLTVVVTATGTLQPKNKVDVGSELSGAVKRVCVDYNGRVKVGQVLAVLDTSKLEATIAQSKASLESARAKALESRATVAETRAKLAQLRKVRELSEGKVPSQTDMTAAEAAFERAKADAANCDAAVSQAEAALRANEADLEKSTIRSPINGIVLTRSVDPGQTVAAAMTTPVLFTLAEDLTKMDLHVNVDEADVSKVREGQSASFTVAAYPRRAFKARIIQVRFGSSTTSGVVTYETVLSVENGDLALRPGMTATADIVVKKVKNGVLVPTAALRFTPPAQDGEANKQSGSLLGALLPHPPHPPANEQRDATTDDKGRQKVWAVQSDKISPIPIVVGSTNGGLAEVLSGDVSPGMSVAVDIVAGNK